MARLQAEVDSLERAVDSLAKYKRRLETDPVLQERIHQRGRDYEQQIAPDYLTRLNTLYDRWAESFSLCPVLTVQTDNLNFVTVNSHLEQIASRVLDKLHGKEVVVLE